MQPNDNLEEGIEVTVDNDSDESLYMYAKSLSDKMNMPRTEASTLHRDVFSLLFVSHIFSLSFLYSLFFFVLQVTILGLISWNLLKDAPDGNPLSVPMRTSLEVTIAQAIALFVSFITQPDVITTLDMIQLGYNHDVKKVFKAACRIKWVIANMCRFFEGILSIVISFIFIIQSTDVLELFLNFAAVQFVSALDDVGFELANTGYVVGGVQEITEKVAEIKFQFQSKRNISGDSKVFVKSIYLQRFVFFISMVALYGSWGFIRFQQESGYYLNQVCQNFDVRFGDQYYDFFVAQPCNASVSNGCPWKNRTRPFHYGPFSDSYEVLRSSTGMLELENGRPVYYQRGQKDGFGDGSPPGKFSYSIEESSWIFSVEGVTKGPMDKSGWLLRSPPATDAYSLHEVPSSGWSIWTNFLEKASPFEISCGECQADVDCNYHGSCVEKQCVCDESWMGKKCQICAGCSELSQRYEFSWSDQEESLPFLRLEGVTLYDRPVFYKNGTNLEKEASNGYSYDKYPNGTIEVMFYAGTRFYIMIWSEFMSDPTSGTLSPEDLKRMQEIFSNFHSTWHLDDNENRTIAFYTPVTNNPMPIEIGWNQFRTSPLAVYSGSASGYEQPVEGMSFDCAIEKEKTMCALPVPSKSY